MKMRWMRCLVACAALPLIASCDSRMWQDEDETVPLISTPPAPVKVTDEQQLAKSLAEELTSCAPMTRPDDVKARDAAAMRLKLSQVCHDLMGEKLSWGGRPTDESYNPEKLELTEFNSLVFRTLYLSLYMFSGEYEIQKHDNYTVLTMVARFRNKLDTGEYPYPFWHKPGKWDGYQMTTGVDFIFEKGKVVAAYRSQYKDGDYYREPHAFNGKWEWTDKKGQQQPRTALYDYLLSPNNPYKGELDKAYREFANAARGQNCMQCHDPENRVEMEKLTLLSFPNQTLTARHEIIDELENNTMPPKSKHAAAGIADNDVRHKLIDLAKHFADTGDKALHYEDAVRVELNRALKPQVLNAAVPAEAAPSAKETAASKN